MFPRILVHSKPSHFKFAPNAGTSGPLSGMIVQLAFETLKLIRRNPFSRLSVSEISRDPYLPLLNVYLTCELQATASSWLLPVVIHSTTSSLVA
jgi:hypothetical protein